MEVVTNTTGIVNTGEVVINLKCHRNRSYFISQCPVFVIVGSKLIVIFTVRCTPTIVVTNQTNIVGHLFKCFKESEAHNVCISIVCDFILTVHAFSNNKVVVFACCEYNLTASILNRTVSIACHLVDCLFVIPTEIVGHLELVTFIQAQCYSINTIFTCNQTKVCSSSLVVPVVALTKVTLTCTDEVPVRCFGCSSTTVLTADEGSINNHALCNGLCEVELFNVGSFIPTLELTTTFGSPIVEQCSLFNYFFFNKSLTLHPSDSNICLTTNNFFAFTGFNCNTSGKSKQCKNEN